MGKVLHFTNRQYICLETMLEPHHTAWVFPDCCLQELIVLVTLFETFQTSWLLVLLMWEVSVCFYGLPEGAEVATQSFSSCSWGDKKGQHSIYLQSLTRNKNHYEKGALSKLLCCICWKKALVSSPLVHDAMWLSNFSITTGCQSPSSSFNRCSLLLLRWTASPSLSTWALLL